MATRFIRNSGFGVITGVSTTLGNFIASLLVARLLGVQNTGIVAFAVWLINTTTTVGAMALPFTLSRYMPELLAAGQSAQANALVGFLFRRFIAVIAIVGSAYLLIALWLYAEPSSLEINSSLAFLNSDPLIFVLLGLCCTTQAIADFGRGYLRGTQQFAQMARLTVLSVIAQLVVIAVGAWAFGRYGALCGYLVANVIPACFIRFPVRQETELPDGLRTGVLRYSRFKWAADIMTAFVWSRIEVLFLQIWWGPESVAYYTVGLTLANIAVQGPLMLTWGLLPRFSEHFGRNELSTLREAYATSTRILALMVLPACFGLAAILPVILPLLFGDAFSGAVPTAVVLVCSASFAASSNAAMTVMWAINRSDIEFYMGLVGAILAVAGGVSIIAAYGPMGAAVSRTIAQFAALGVGYWYLSRRLEFPAPIADLVRLFAASAACAAAAHVTLIVVPGTKGLPLAILAGVVVYAAAIRVLRPLPQHDIQKLRLLIGLSPEPLKALANSLLTLVVRP